MVFLPDAAARGPGLKFLLVAAITLVMALPLYFIVTILTDRQEYALTAAADIERGWGGPQKLAGPLLAVPYSLSSTTFATDGTGSTIDARHVAIFLPKTLTADIDSTAKARARGIFDVNVYTATVGMKGIFQRPDFAKLGIAPTAIAWDQATTLMPIGDLHGLSENVTMRWDAARRAVEFSPGLTIMPLSGISARVPLSAETGDIPFDVTVKLRGTRQLMLAATAGETIVNARGNWPHPSFQGSFLPASHEITAQGFKASWRVPHLARNLPQASRNTDVLAQGLEAASFGVSFVQPVNFYLLVERALKYAMMFIGSVFLSFFLIETLSGARIHGVQYLLIGGAQVVFYLLLLSFAEQAGFDVAYLIAASAAVLLISAYGLSALKSWTSGGIVFGVLSVLYTLLFMLLKQEDHALVIGACAAFAAIALTMYVTRNVDWYGSPKAVASPQ
ncbi:MAG: cell envelope integrity protein CreD [Alphaproteobacteria bacterium]|nr:cell envelope integrity protein CreD [Alphaproteobacteria bacterium]